jgi:serine/threonine protein kinase
MLSGMFPFHPDNSNESLDDQITKGKFKFPKRQFNHVRGITQKKYLHILYFFFFKVSEHARHVIRLMLKVNPNSRGELSQLLRHDWMRDPELNRRLEKAIEHYYGTDFDDDDTLTEEMENVALNEDIHHRSKRPRFG